MTTRNVFLSQNVTEAHQKRLLFLLIFSLLPGFVFSSVLGVSCQLFLHPVFLSPEPLLTGRGAGSEQGIVGSKR